MPFITGGSQITPDERYQKSLKEALGKGWIMISEGPSGAQLELPKRMKGQTKGAIIVGILLVFLYGIGVIIIAAALIDYAMQKKETQFISRL